VWGTQPEEERNEALRKFKTKEVQVLVNCQVVAVGFDYPPTTTLVLGRPTRSRSFWLQCVGRATRPLPGVVDFPGSTADSRIAAIAASGKRHFKIVDCTTGSVDHSIITAIDMFVSDEEVKKRVREAAHAKPLSPEEIAELAAQEAAKLAAAKQIEEMRKATQGRGDGHVRTEDIDIRFQGKRSVGTYRNPLRGKFHHWPMNRLPDFYVRWGTKNTNGWVRQLFVREEMRREKQTA
jgi:superfamily II DNA or RNA helicase